MWSLAIAIAGLGVVLCFVLGRLWPLVAVSGLAIPMMPLGARRSGGPDAPASHVG